jgi:hypothetical protein
MYLVDGAYTLLTRYHVSFPLLPFYFHLIALTKWTGRLDDLHTWLVEERFPQGWQPRMLGKNGLTLLDFNSRGIKIYLMQDPLPFLEPLHPHKNRD